jgi:hypothetical protein
MRPLMLPPAAWATIPSANALQEESIGCSLPSAPSMETSINPKSFNPPFGHRSPKPSGVDFAMEFPAEVEAESFVVAVHSSGQPILTVTSGPSGWTVLGHTLPQIVAQPYSLTHVGHGSVLPAIVSWQIFGSVPVVAGAFVLPPPEAVDAGGFVLPPPEAVVAGAFVLPPPEA